MKRTYTTKGWVASGPRGGIPILRRTRKEAIMAWVKTTGRLILSDNDYWALVRQMRLTGWLLRKATVTITWDDE